MASHISLMSNPSPISRNSTSPRSRVVVSSVVVTRSTSVVTIKHANYAAVKAEGKAEAPLAAVWREIQGSDDWQDLMEPLNPLLRSEIVRYGEFVAACYKAFDLDPSSKRYLNCKHGKPRMLRAVGMEDSGYAVTKYIYATPDINIPTRTAACRSRWIGYVAVSDDENVKKIGRRDILVSFRGTVTPAEWLANLMSSLTPARLDPHDPRPDVKVESGFLNVYTSDDSSNKFSNGSCREQVLSETARLINKHKHEELSITLAGHSMGSSIALLLGYDLAELGLNRDAAGREVPITVYSFGGPRVGNLGFKERCEDLGVKVLRVVNVNDPITKLPGVFLNESSPWRCLCYAHVGVELTLDFFKMMNPACVHDIDHYVGLLKSCSQVERMINKEGFDSFTRVSNYISLQKQKWDTAWQWQDAARHVIANLVQSIRI
ncbi:galactolipase DONGLE, chloroplastic-like [Typha latifolia]|uniref:galactolipase DONGLE, chloroplastic-like n=1 Tax=Typha latifolia TaxID=4733 RepID=UPI003C309782